MNVLSKMSPDDQVEIILNGQTFKVSVGSIIKTYVLLGNSNGGYDELFYRIGKAYDFGSEDDDQIDIVDIEYYTHRDEVHKVFLSDYYDNQTRKNQIKYEIEEKCAELLELKSEYLELTGEEYGN